MKNSVQSGAYLKTPGLASVVSRHSRQGRDIGNLGRLQASSGEKFLNRGSHAKSLCAALNQEVFGCGADTSCPTKPSNKDKSYNCKTSIKTSAMTV